MAAPMPAPAPPPTAAPIAAPAPAPAAVPTAVLLARDPLWESTLSVFTSTLCPLTVTATRVMAREARLNFGFFTSVTRKKALAFAGTTVTPSTTMGSSRFAAYSLFKLAVFESMRSTVLMAISVPIGSVILCGSAGAGEGAWASSAQLAPTSRQIWPKMSGEVLVIRVLLDYGVAVQCTTQCFCGPELLFLTINFCVCPSPGARRASQVFVS